ncbi:MAG: membrane protein insertion efficiency factor YidD [Deltaproteobacteria bacterium]|nr:membrane protein insertion efficiency factor YidD [Deltaproteobacteria bacterium]
MMSALVARLLRALLRGYQLALSPLVGPACRFAPSCSEFAREALALHGPWHGSLLALRRLSRCHPLGGSGFDPVPEPTHRRAGALAHSSRSDA